MAEKMDRSKKMKKRWICMIYAAIFIFAMSLTGCAEQTPVTEEKDITFLTASEYWYHYDEVTGESEKMSFRDDFTFYWGCECGEPIGDSDCYERFDYDGKTSLIKLYSDHDDTSMEMEVIDYNDYFLILKADGKIKGYTHHDSELDIADAQNYLAGYSGEFYMPDGNTEEILLGPFDYDGDVKYPDNAMKTYAYAEGAKAYSLFTFTHIKDGVVVEDTADYQEITLEEAATHIEYGAGGFVWFNEQMQISKILIYGATVAEE